MNLTTANKQALKAAVAAETDPEFVTLRNAGSTGAMADWLNQPLAATWYAWRTSMPVSDVMDQVIWANMTPAEAVPVDTTLNTSIWHARSLACQGKQFNLQTMLQGRETINPSKANIRAGLQDALTSIPSGVNGNNRNAGWSALQLMLSRPVTRGERIFATGTGSQAVPGTLVVEGLVTDQNVVEALNS